MPTEMPLVSVVVPNYNYEKFLPQRLQSIVGQTYKNIEIIILDDCSTDNSMQVIEAFAQNEPRVVSITRNDKNGGSPFRQWQKGIAMAKGEFIWIAESDDDADISLLSKCVEQLMQNDNATLCYTGSYTIDENNNKLNKEFDNWTKEHLKQPIATYNGNTFVKQNMYWLNYIYNASCVVFRRSAALNVQNNRWVDMHSCGDWHFWTELATLGDVITIREKLNRFRRHSNSVTAQSSSMDAKFKTALKECMDLTFGIERRFGIDSYRKAISHGSYMLLYKRQKLSAETKAELVSYLSNNSKNIRAEYILYRIYRFLKKFFKSLDLIRKDRL